MSGWTAFGAWNGLQNALHGRKDYREFWEKLRGYSIDFGRVFLCTDYPEEAGSFFGKGLIQKGGDL